MKNKFLPIFLLFVVNNFQCAAERFNTISGGEFSDLVDVNRVKKELTLLDGKTQRTRNENLRIAYLKICIARHDKKIEDQISLLKKEDKLKYAPRIKFLEQLKSERLDDKVVEEAKKGLSEIGKAYYYTDNRIFPSVLAALVAGLFIYNFFCR